MPNYVGETRAKAEEDLKNTYKVSSKMITIEEVETSIMLQGQFLNKPQLQESNILWIQKLRLFWK